MIIKKLCPNYYNFFVNEFFWIFFRASGFTALSGPDPPSYLRYQLTVRLINISHSSNLLTLLCCEISCQSGQKRAPQADSKCDQMQHKCFVRSTFPRNFKGTSSSLLWIISWENLLLLHRCNRNKHVLMRVQSADAAFRNMFIWWSGALKVCFELWPSVSPPGLYSLSVIVPCSNYLAVHSLTSPHTGPRAPCWPPICVIYWYKPLYMSQRRRCCAVMSPSDIFSSWLGHFKAWTFWFIKAAYFISDLLVKKQVK